MKSRTIIKSVVSIGNATLISRFFGMARDLLLMRYLGAGPVADAFIAAFRLPNSLRKIFAEGALSAALIPTLVTTLRTEGKAEASRLMTLMMILVEGILFLLCLFICIQAQYVVTITSPGFSYEQANNAQLFLRILIFFIFFLSSCSLFAGALQAVKKFFVPAAGQIFLNIFFIGTLLLCLYKNFSAITLAYGIILSSILLTLIHAIAYIRSGFSFSLPTKQTWRTGMHVMGKFLPCIISIGAMEINIFIDQSFVSYLPAGSMALFYYTSNFVRIPLGVFAVSLATVLLPHFSHVSTYAPRRLGYYMLEASKIIFWIIVPASILLAIFSYQIFATTLLSESFTLDHVKRAQELMTALCIGLFFFSLNKVVLNVYYALHSTILPTIITVGCTALNTLLNYLVIQKYGLNGIAYATSAVAALQSIIFLIILHVRYKLPFYTYSFILFIKKALMQFCFFGCLLYILYQISAFIIMQLPIKVAHLFMNTFLYWFWVGPLFGIIAISFYVTRRAFGIKIKFLDS